MRAIGYYRRNPLLVALAAGASFAALSSIFGYTMWLHYRAIDLPYAGFAAVRILAISVAVGGAAYWCGPRRSRVGALLFGAAVGVIAGVAYVYAATA